MPKAITRKAKIPAEKIISVRNGATCYTGIATSFTLAGEDVIIIARTLNQLNIIYNKYFPSVTLRVDFCYDVTMLARSDSTIDDEL